MSEICELQLNLLALAFDYLPYDQLATCYQVCKTFYQCRHHIQNITLLYDPGHDLINHIVATFLSVPNSVSNFDIYTDDPIPLAEIALVFGKTLRHLRVRTETLSYLRVFPKLEHATLFVSDLSRIHELKNLPSRPTINLVPNDELDIEYPERLAQIPNLVALNLSRTRLPNLHFLSGLKSLREIHLACLLEDIPLDALSVCTQLTELNVAGRDDHDISWISLLVNLTRVSLRHWHSLVDISPIRNLHKLQFIDLCQCHQLEHIDALAECRHLLELNLRSTAVTDISSLIDNCMELRKLDLRDTPEKNLLQFVRQCSQLPKLRHIYLGKRRVSESDSDESEIGSDSGQTEVESGIEDDDDVDGNGYIETHYAF